jgi:VMA21-like domain
LDPQNRTVGAKLAVASACMVVLPIVTFLIALHFCQDKEAPDTWAGGAAILMTNLIVAGYCYSAYVEDKEEEPTISRFDDEGPRVGIFKQRVD